MPAYATADPKNTSRDVRGLDAVFLSRLCRSPVYILSSPTQTEQSVTKRHLPRGLDDRTRDQNPPKAGQIREKRADTQIGTLRKEYGENLAEGYRSDTHLGTVRDETGKSLHQLVKKSQGG